MNGFGKFLIIFCLSVCFGAVAQIPILSSEFDSRMMSQQNLSIPIAKSHQILSLEVNAKVKNQVVDVMVTQEIINNNYRDMEVEVFFPLPVDASIQNFVMMVDGKEISGELLSRKEAESIYEGIVRRKKDPALMRYVGYGLFKTSVFPMRKGEKRKLTMRYSQLILKENEQFEFTYPLTTQSFSSSPLQKLDFKLTIESDAGVNNHFSRSHQMNSEKKSNQLLEMTLIKENFKPKQDISVFWSESNDALAYHLTCYQESNDKDGYFMFLASPKIEKSAKIVNKEIIFILDQSGSMNGTKLIKCKKALKAVIQNLNPGDLFNIIAYNDRLEFFENELQKYSDKTSKTAIDFIDRLEAGGATNIQHSILSGLRQFSGDELSPKYILFLTDGVPTSGETSEMKIDKVVKITNAKKSRIFCFGVGNDVNARLLDKLSLSNGGFTEYVKENEDIEASVSKIYKGIDEPEMTNISVKIDGVSTSNIYPTDIPDVFKGGQMMIVGKYRKAGKPKVTITGIVGGEQREFNFNVAFKGSDKTIANSYVEKFWATKRIAYLLNELDVNGKNDEFVSELVALSKKHGILTPYTAYLAREDVELNDQVLHLNQSTVKLKKMEETSGFVAVESRKYKNKLATGGMVSSEEMNRIVAPSSDLSNISTMNGNTFYLKDGIWIESDITDEEKKNATKIKKFSEEYFNLAKTNSAEVNSYLSNDKSVFARINGVVYNFVE